MDTLLTPVNDEYGAYTLRSFALEFLWALYEHLKNILKMLLYIVFTHVATPLWPSVGVKPNTPKVGDLESSKIPECLEFDSKAQNTSHWGVLSVIGKVLKRNIKNGLALAIWTFAAQVMGKRKAGSQIGTTTKSRESTSSRPPN